MKTFNMGKAIKREMQLQLLSSLQDQVQEQAKELERHRQAIDYMSRRYEMEEELTQMLRLDYT